MKKNLLTLFTCAALSLVTITGCNYDLKDSDYRPAPTAKAGSKTIQIAISKISNDTKYISIYRYLDTGSGAPDSSEKGINIGMIRMEHHKNAEAYVYEDLYAVETKDYYYRIRYYTSDDNYAYSKWSEKVTVPSGFGVTTQVPKLTSNTVNYDADTKEIEFVNAVTWSGSAPAGFATTHYIAVSTSDNNSSDLIPLNSAVGAGDKKRLRDLLPSSYLGKDITLNGLVAVKEVKDTVDSTKTLYYVFTEPSAVTGPDKINCPIDDGPKTFDYR